MNLNKCRSQGTMGMVLPIWVGYFTYLIKVEFNEYEYLLYEGFVEYL
jgi:hypothetical protein